jgi:hypothetical protein
MFDGIKYNRRFSKKKFVFGTTSILKLDARLAQTLLYVDAPTSAKTSSERFYEYVLNLMALPMPLPVSPFYLLMTRPEYSKLYISSSASICSLKKLYSIRALHCETKIKNMTQLKIVNDDMVRTLEEEDVEYGNLLTSFTERYQRCVSESEALFTDRGDVEMSEKCEIICTEVVPVIEAVCYEMVEAMYFHLIRVTNIVECACINLYVHNVQADPELLHLAEIEGVDRTVKKEWSYLTTHNCLSSTKNLSFSRTSVEFRRKMFFDPTAGGGYMFGKEGRKDWNGMCAVQCNYINSLLREHMKIPGFRDKYDECCNNVVYQYFSKRCYDYMTSYDEKKDGENDQTKLDVFCASSYACIQFLNIYLAKKLFDQLQETVQVEL